MSDFEAEYLTRVDPGVFMMAYETARGSSGRIADATSPFTDTPGAFYWLTADAMSGFCVREDGELVFVFSAVKGRGAALAQAAIDRGAVYLDCFEGYLPTFYARHGFQIDATVANWTPGGPAVVYMSRPGYASRHGIAS